MPVVLTLILVMVQVALTWHAKTIIDAAASDGLIAAQVDGGTEADGQEAATRLLSSSTGQLLTDVSITIDRRPEATSVNVEAKVTNVLPFLPVTVHAVASGPTERFRSESEAQ